MATKIQCERAIERYETGLERRKNVVGLGIVPSERYRSKQPDFEVAVYVSKKVPKEKLSSKDLIPCELTLKYQGRTLNIKTRVIEQGLVELE